MKLRTSPLIIPSFTLRSLLILIILLIIGDRSYAQFVENEIETRTGVELQFEPLEKVKISIGPEVRFDEDLSIDKFLLEGEVESELLKSLEIAASYGIMGNVRDTKDTEYLNRYAFSTKYEKDFNRFETSFRLKYSNYADDDVTDKEFLRYRLGLEYDIPDCKITPSVSIEPYQNLNDGNLYKTRYKAGVDYKLFKKNYLKASYELDYYKNEYKNRHILSIGYKIKF